MQRAVSSCRPLKAPILAEEGSMLNRRFRLPALGVTALALALPLAAQAAPPPAKAAAKAAASDASADEGLGDHPPLDDALDPNAIVDGIVQRRTQPMAWKAQRTKADLPRAIGAKPKAPGAAKAKPPAPKGGGGK